MNLNKSELIGHKMTSSSSGPSWALSGRFDPTAVKQDIERRLEAEERKVAEVDAAMKASEDITNDMARICQSSLSDFKARFHPISNNLWTKCDKKWPKQY